MKIENSHPIATFGLAAATVTGAATLLALKLLNRYQSLMRPLAGGTAATGLATLTVALWPTGKKGAVEEPKNEVEKVYLRGKPVQVGSRDSRYPYRQQDRQQVRITNLNHNYPTVADGDGWLLVELREGNQSDTVLLPDSWLTDHKDGDRLELRIDGQRESREVHYLLTDKDNQPYRVSPNDHWVVAEGPGDKDYAPLPASLLRREGPVTFHLGGNRCQLELDQRTAFHLGKPPKSHLDALEAYDNMVKGTSPKLGLDAPLSCDAAIVPLKSNNETTEEVPFWPKVDQAEELPSLFVPYLSKELTPLYPEHVNTAEEAVWAMFPQNDPVDPIEDILVIHDRERIFISVKEKMYAFTVEERVLPATITSVKFSQQGYFLTFKFPR